MTWAKAVRQRCPVRPECLHSAQFHASNDGVWGGLDVHERRELRRGRAGSAEQGAG
ncbi:WhiB family transcriptional regulator [Umezawaea endophytica]|uniref:WhiB family transcriptional regulator n=1 Tax=Umezawaea endophytica TaxID=1654476 RepID=A0A9X2VM97_9PSEU|nr:WhiB family transcriptional regulator [Umezawaea endophytica]MCS7479135.1 WhiB family transcriptional regulator [Umezawaea endophytica]